MKQFSASRQDDYVRENVRSKGVEEVTNTQIYIRRT